MQDYDSASSCQGIYDALPNLEPFVQFKKREKHQWKSVITKSNTPFFSIFELYKW